jgi:hypothetical protein
MSDISLLNPAEHNYEPGLSVLHHNTVSQVGALSSEAAGLCKTRNVFFLHIFTFPFETDVEAVA